MWRLVTTGLMAVAGVAIAAPGPKDAPKKDSPIAGEWRLVLINGQKTTTTTYTFCANGDLVGHAWIGSAESGFRMRYALSERTDPHQIDMTDEDVREEGIFKIEGERLTICYRVGRGQRPKKFGQEGATQYEFERLKEKD